MHITHAPTNVKEVKLCVLVLFTCAWMKVVSWVIFDIDHHPTQIYNEDFHFITIFWIINVVSYKSILYYCLIVNVVWNNNRILVYSYISKI